jgi:ligand-binding SRPBCC domain-containing protein
VGEATLERRVWLSQSLAEVFGFCSDAGNLEALRPSWLHFEIVTAEPITMGRGTRIDYRLRLHGAPVRWQADITEWEPPHRFVDEQLQGPYRLWVHEHTFEERDGGTLARDVVLYAVPGGWLIPELFVKRDLQRVFDYREAELRELLGQRLDEAETRQSRLAPGG